MRKFLENVVDYPYAVILLIAFLFVFGLYVLQNKITVEREPDIVVPYVMIHQLYPGASPSEVEQKITRRIEDKLLALDDVDYIESMSYDGGLEVVVKFLNNDDLDDVKREVEEIVNLAKPDFPDDAEEPVIETRSFDDTPILLVSLTNSDEKVDLDVLKTYADELKATIEDTEGVAYIDVYGDIEHEIHIEVDPLKAKAKGFTVDEIARLVQNEHQNFPAGDVETARKNLLIKTQGEFASADDIRQMKIKLANGDEINITKLAKVIRTTRKRTSYSRFNGKPSVTLIVKGKDKINVFNVVKDIQTKIENFKVDLPPSISVDTVQDAGSDIRLMINQLGSSAIYGAILVLVLLIIMIGVRNAVLVGFAIPFTILFGIIFLYLFEYSINTITIFAMIVILGLVVDGAIIVSENIFRHIEEGKNPKKAAKRGISEVGPSVFIADITTICAFLPIAFMSGMTGDYLIYLPITVILTLVGSMLIDHFGLPVIIPRMSFRFINKQKILQSFVDFPARMTQRFRVQRLKKEESEDDFHKSDTKKIEKQVLNTPEPVVTVEDLAMTFSDDRVAKKFPELGQFYDEAELKSAIVHKYYDEKTTRRFKPAFEKTEEEKPEVPKTKRAGAMTFRRVENVRRWKLDFKSILDESEDLREALEEQLELAGKLEEIKNKPKETNGELVDSFVQAIKDAKNAQDKGLVTSFWRKGEAPEVRDEAQDFQEEKRIIIPPPLELRAEEPLEVEQPVYKTRKNKEKEHDTERRERDLLTEKASPLVKFIRVQYGLMLNSLIRFRYLIFAFVLVAASFALFTILSGQIGMEYIPHIDRSRFFIRVKLPVGTPIKRTSEVVSEIESVIDDYSQDFRNIGRESYIKSYITTIGDTNALLVDLREYSESGTELGKIQVELVDIEKRTLTQYDVIQELRSRMPVFPDAEITVDEVFEGPPTGADISLKVTGENSKTVHEAARIIKEKLERIEGAEDVSIDYQPTKPLLEITINREKASKFNVNSTEVGMLLRSAIHGYESGEIIKGDDEIKIVTLLQDSENPDFERLSMLPVRTNDNELITLEEVVDYKYTSIPKAIRHYNNKRAISIRCKLAPGLNTKQIENKIIEEINADEELKKLIPSNVKYSLVGETEERDKSFEELTISLFVALMLILFVLLLYFNSFRITLIIILAIPLGFTGVVFGLYLTDNTFNLMSFIGVVALMGIVVNDAIVLVDCIKDNRKKGFSLRNSVIRAGQIRLRPVILTSATTILGLLPLTLNFSGGGYFWQPLCIAIIFGILFATLLTLIVIPLAYFELYRRGTMRQTV